MTDSVQFSETKALISFSAQFFLIQSFTRMLFNCDILRIAAWISMKMQHGAKKKCIKEEVIKYK